MSDAEVVPPGELHNLKTRLHDILHDEETPIGRFAAIAEARTKVAREKLAAVVIVLLLLYIALCYGARLLCNFIGFIYPAYSSLRALETPTPDDDKKWLIYWVSFAFFSFVEFFGDIFLWWIPFYWSAKCLVLLFLMFPGQYNGSLILYNRFIRPFYLKNEAKIDKVVKAAENAAISAMKDACQVMADEQLAMEKTE